FSYGIIDDFLITRIHVFETTEIAGTLYIVVTAHGIAARARSSIVTCDKQQVGKSGTGITAMAMLRDAHCPKQADRLRSTYHFSGFDQGCQRNVRHFRRVFHGEGFDRAAILLYLPHPFLQEFLVRESLLKHVAGKGCSPD